MDPNAGIDHVARYLKGWWNQLKSISVYSFASRIEQMKFFLFQRPKMETYGDLCADEHEHWINFIII